VGKLLPGLNHSLTKEWMDRSFFNKKFSQDERRRLLGYLNAWASPQYGGKGEKISIVWAMRTKRGWSWLAHLWIRPPVKVQAQMPINLEDIRGQLDEAKGLIPRLSREAEAKLALNINALKKQWKDDWKHRLTGMSDYHYHAWPAFFQGLVDFFYDKDNVSPGWFHPNSRPVSWWLDELEMEAVIPQNESQGRQPELSL